MIDPNSNKVSKTLICKTSELKTESIDPDAFKKYQYASEEEPEECPNPQAIPLSPFTLFTQPQGSIEMVSTPSIGPLPATMQLLNDQLIIQVIHAKQLQQEQTVITLHEPGSLLDGVEIFIESFSFAPHSVNIEIKSCGKLQALLQKHQEQLLERWSLAGINTKLQRLDFSVHSNRSNRKIDGTNRNKVTQVGNKQSHDDSP